MKYLILVLVFMGISGAFVANATSLLVPAQFPKTVSDMSFVDRMEIESEGYEPYEGLSAYQIIEFEAMEDYAQRELEKELQAAGIELCDGCDANGLPPVQDGSTIVPGAKSTTAQTETIQSTTAQTTTTQTNASVAPASGYCSRRNANIPSGQKIPFGLPVNTADLSSNISSKAKSIVRNTNKGLFCSPYGCHRKRPHEGIDIGCHADFYQMPIYATADGVVDHIVSAGKNQSAGNYIRINHGNGWISQYMHLDKMFVAKGQKVEAGCLIGLMGHTGGNRDQKVRKMDVNLTHLHYEIVYSGSASYVQAPNGKRVPIVRGDKKLGPCGNFKSKVYPNDIMVYQ